MGSVVIITLCWLSKKTLELRVDKGKEARQIMMMICQLGKERKVQHILPGNGVSYWIEMARLEKP